MNKNKWFEVLANDKTKGLYQRLVAHIADSLTECADLDISRIDVTAFVNRIADDDSVWEYLDNIIMKELRKEVIKTMKVKEGVCPICGCKELEYDSIQLEGDMMYYPWRCCANAEHTGEEWYNLTFAGHNVINEDGEELILESGGED